MSQVKEILSPTDRVKLEFVEQAIHVLCLRDTLSYVDIVPLQRSIEAGLNRANEHTVLVIDCSTLVSIEPGVAGRLLANSRDNGPHYRRWVFVTKSRTIVSLARAAITMYRGASGQFATNSGEGLALARALVAESDARESLRGARSRGRIESAEIRRPGVGALANDVKTRSTG